MLAGAQDGLRLMFSLIPTLILMLTAVTMLRRSGFFELLTPVFAPVFRLLGMRRRLRRWCSSGRSAAVQRWPSGQT